MLNANHVCDRGSFLSKALHVWHKDGFSSDAVGYVMRRGMFTVLEGTHRAPHSEPQDRG